MVAGKSSLLKEQSGHGEVEVGAAYWRQTRESSGSKEQERESIRVPGLHVVNVCCAPFHADFVLHKTPHQASSEPR